MDALFLDHYDRELAFLREMGNEFAAKYPKLAGQLGLDEFQCSDPFVERLLEGFAFMSARVQRRMDAEYPQLVRALFDAIFPHYARPIPSAAIFQINPAHDEGSLIDGYTVPKGTRLYARPARGQQTGCRFDTTNEVQLWPLRISRAQVFSREAPSVVPVPPSFHASTIRSGLWLTLETTAAVSVNQLQLDHLRFHLRGGEIAEQIYQLLLANVVSVAMAGESADASLCQESWRELSMKQIRPVGLEASEALLPGDCRSFSGYRLLQELFLLPEKFLFVELTKLHESLSKLSGHRIHLLFGFDEPPTKLLERTSHEHFALHCVPGINLFRRRADRTHLDHSQHEHQIIIDRSRPIDYEIWSIEEMAAHITASNVESPCLPLYEPAPAEFDGTRSHLYYALDRRFRVASQRSGHPDRSNYFGTEIFVSLTDSQSTPHRREFQQLSSLLYCTNRDLPLLIPDGGWRTAFQAETAGPIANVLCLTGPTPPRPPLVSDDGDATWRLVSHLTPNYLTLSDGEQSGCAMLRELLHLYCNPDLKSSSKRIEGLRHIRQQPVVRRIPLQGPLTFARGIEIEIVCDEDAFEGGSPFLLGSILEQFFSRFVAINSFTETHLVSSRGHTIHRWPVRMGTTPAL